MEIVTNPTGTVQACAAATPLSLADFDFDLPPERIAQTPAAERDAARLLVLDRRSGVTHHGHVRDLAEHLHPGDLLVVNDTRVVPARLFGRSSSGGSIELLLIRPLASGWLCLGKPARRLRVGATLQFADAATATVLSVHGDGRYTVEFDGHTDVGALMQQHGEVPLPPYIKRPDGPLPLDHTRYQTIFAAAPGAIAAPTAGLHFTELLLEALRVHDVRIASLTLHVGPGTFLPVRSDDVRRHAMDPEWYQIPPATADAIRATKRAGRRVIAIGTTTTRALESAAEDAGTDIVRTGAQWAERFIVPGYRFRVVDALFTNFHLPGSTLLLLVCALAGRERLLGTYAEAIRHGYRFYSYGDAMLIQ